MASRRKPDVAAALENILRRVRQRNAAAVLDLGATIDELLAVPGATRESVFEALTGASRVADKARQRGYNAISSSVTAGFERELDHVQRELFEAAGLSGSWTWVAILRNSCDSGLELADGRGGGCRQRHGQTFTDEELADIGEPRGGGTICGWNCECYTIPAESAHVGGEIRGELREAIKRPRRARK